MVGCCGFHYIYKIILFYETNIKAIHDISYIVLEMSSEQDTTVVPLSSLLPERLLGQVKWFNNKAGYGFITVNDGDYSGKDIFIHYSAIRVTNSQYKYLVQGEYVEFSLVKSSTDGHEFQAIDISGVKGGALMCETRRNSRPVRDGPVAGADESAVPRAPRQEQRRYKTSGDDSRAPGASAGDGEFTTVRRRKPQGARPPRKEKVVAELA
uniref:CSD domain-containing protein n=1 Tax=viral metagenome TaxID=1070528 RepID=A0A6C0L6R0_9ZZZZ